MRGGSTNRMTSRSNAKALTPTIPENALYKYVPRAYRVNEPTASTCLAHVCSIGLVGGHQTLWTQGDSIVRTDVEHGNRVPFRLELVTKRRGFSLEPWELDYERGEPSLSGQVITELKGLQSR